MNGNIKSNHIPIKETAPDKGLSRSEVSLREQGGLVNKAVASPGKTEKQIIKGHCFTFFNMLFVFLAGLLVFCGAYKDAVFVVVAIVNTAIGIFQELKSKRTVDKLTLMSARKVPTVRDGRVESVASDKLVRDDIVEFSAGDQIIADAVVCEGSVQVNEALITGEADAISKLQGAELLSGSFVLSGKCRARLTAVGDESYASKLTLAAKKDTKVSKSEMMRSLSVLIKVIGFIIIPLGIMMFIKQRYVLCLTFSAAIQATVASVTGMIPDGLYLVTSVALAVSVMRLAKKRVLSRDLNCIETLARVDVLCVDKTGTITENKMTAHDPVLLFGAGMTANQIEDILTAFYCGADKDNDTARAMAERFDGTGEWKCTSRIPFTSATKWSSATLSGQGSFIVGAPEFILKNSYGAVRDRVEEYSRQGYRVLLLAAYSGTPDQKGLVVSMLHPLALIPLSNKIRHDAPDTFRYFAEQGVCVKVISGDNPTTVSEVARQAGIENAESYVDASTLKTDKDYLKAVDLYTVFGRVTPEQKLKLVKALKSKKHTVAMTGDGVNDVLALKDADCGIAMASGSEAACLSAKLVLLDDSFGALPQVVAEGRRVINNIQRVAAMFLVKNIFSFLITLTVLAFSLPYPLIPRHLAMISMLTIGIPSFFLAMEPNENQVKGRFLLSVFRQASPGGIINYLIILLLEAFTVLFHFPHQQLNTMAAMVVTFVGILVLYQVCKPLNIKRGILIAAVSLGVVFCVTEMNWYFNFTPPTPQTLLVTGVLLVLAAYAMRTILWVFDSVEAWFEKIRDRHREKKAAKAEARDARKNKKHNIK